MYIEVDVEESPNCDLSLVKVFESNEGPRIISRVQASRPGYPPEIWNITGWSEQGPSPAFAAKVSDSGEGIVLLIYGGNLGIRLKPTNSTSPWSLMDKNQWGEPCLLLAPDSFTE